jgi:hypothetical protein
MADNDESCETALGLGGERAPNGGSGRLKHLPVRETVFQFS